MVDIRMIESIWDQFLAIIKQEAGSRVVETWLKVIIFERWDAQKNVVYLRAPNTFVQQWVSNNYLPLMQFHLKRLFNVSDINIVFVEQENAHQKSESSTAVIPACRISEPSTAVVSANVLVPVEMKHTHNHIKQGYGFDTFVVGPSNSLAYAAAHAVTEKPGLLYNPLFLYGSSGLGKTHLLHAIGNRIKQLNSKAMVVYQSTDRFINEFINAIRFDHVHKFQNKYKSVDVLLIDDIQFLSHKEQTQEAFFHIFNILYEFRKQIVFSSDTEPKGIAGLAERLRSRLEWGLVADIQVPTIETKIAILKKKADLNNEHIDDKVAHFVASHATSNIRELEGALIRVSAFAKLTGQPITVEVAKRVLHGESPVPRHLINGEKIAKAVCSFYSYSVADVRSGKRNKDLALVRHIAMYFMKRFTDHSLQEIGNFWGRKDHSTVLHAINKVT